MPLIALNAHSFHAAGLGAGMQPIIPASRARVSRESILPVALPAVPADLARRLAQGVKHAQQPMVAISPAPAAAFALAIPSARPPAAAFALARPPADRPDQLKTQLLEIQSRLSDERPLFRPSLQDRMRDWDTALRLIADCSESDLKYIRSSSSLDRLLNDLLKEHITGPRHLPNHTTNEVIRFAKVYLKLGFNESFFASNYKSMFRVDDFEQIQKCSIDELAELIETFKGFGCLGEFSPAIQGRQKAFHEEA